MMETSIGILLKRNRFSAMTQGTLPDVKTLALKIQAFGLISARESWEEQSKNLEMTLMNITVGA
jgi:hypothetical protein